MKRKWTTSVTTVKADKLTARGVDQTSIIKNWSIEEMVFLLLIGRKPKKKEANLLRAVILSHTGHSITGQSSIAAVMGADTSASFLNAMFAGFLVGSGPYHQGALQSSMEGLIDAKKHENKLVEYINDKIQHNERIYGYGHRFQKADPRAKTLIGISELNKFSHGYVDLAKRIEKILYKKKKIKMNIEAAGAAILLNLGFDSRIASLIIVLGRSASYAAMFLERLKKVDHKPFQKVEIYDVVN